MSAPVSQMSVAALRQRTNDAGASRFWVSAILLEHEGEVLADEL
jgi:hypothetical protein